MTQTLPSLICDGLSPMGSEGYGGEMHVDRPCVGVTWATFLHLCVDDYVAAFDVLAGFVDWLDKLVTDKK